MTKIFNSISQFFKNLINDLSKIVTIAEHALQTQFRIKPIQKENLGILNSMILASGLISSLLLINIINPVNPILSSVELILICLIFVLSILLIQNHYIHTIITFFCATSLFTWLNNVSVGWSPLVYGLVILIIFLFITYFDLLKHNIILQLSNVVLLFSFFNVDFFDKFQFSNYVNSGFDLNATGVVEQMTTNLFPLTIVQLLILPILYVAIQVARRTNRIAFSKIMTPIFYVFLLLLIISILIFVPNVIRPFILILILLSSVILALNNQFWFSFLLMFVFMVSCLYYIFNNSNFGESTTYLIAITIFPLITFFSIVAKYFVDKGSVVN